MLAGNGRRRRGVGGRHEVKKLWDNMRCCGTSGDGRQVLGGVGWCRQGVTGCHEVSQDVGKVSQDILRCRKTSQGVMGHHKVLRKVQYATKNAKNY